MSELRRHMMMQQDVLIKYTYFLWNRSFSGVNSAYHYYTNIEFNNLKIKDYNQVLVDSKSPLTYPGIIITLTTLGSIVISKRDGTIVATIEDPNLEHFRLYTDSIPTNIYKAPLDYKYVSLSGEIKELTLETFLKVGFGKHGYAAECDNFDKPNIITNWASFESAKMEAWSSYSWDWSAAHKRAFTILINKDEHIAKIYNKDGGVLYLDNLIPYYKDE